MKPQEAMPHNDPADASGTGPASSADAARREKPDPANDQKPAAGPHAKPQLTDPEKTPGAGALPDPDKPLDPDATG